MDQFIQALVGLLAEANKCQGIQDNETIKRVLSLLQSVGTFADPHSDISKIEIRRTLNEYGKYLDISDDMIEEASRQLDLRSNNFVLKKANPLPVSQANTGPRTDHTLRKPQLAFQHMIDNSYAGFLPRLKSKPFAKVELSKELIAAQSTPIPVAFLDQDGHKLTTHNFENQYKPEIESLEPWPEQDREPKKPLPMDDCPFFYVDTEEKLDDLVSILENAKEIAFDLEHHSIRSYQGITCLIQVSTREVDAIIDPFPVWTVLGDKLRSVFANPAILKVLHGSDSDVLWLQRDFSLPVVNLFDTGQASRVLEKKSHKLSTLLSDYCNILADKKYQLADWRMRPLSSEMLKYAREDTHFLLYIYDCLYMELLEADKLESCFRRSQVIAGTSYQKPVLKDYNYYMLISRNREISSRPQLSVLKALLKWRDYAARNADESTGYVMPNYMIFKIAKEKPKTRSELRDACRGNFPTHVETQQDLIINKIKKAVSKYEDGGHQVNTKTNLIDQEKKVTSNFGGEGKRQIIIVRNFKEVDCGIKKMRGPVSLLGEERQEKERVLKLREEYNNGDKLKPLIERLKKKAEEKIQKNPEVTKEETKAEVKQETSLLGKKRKADEELVMDLPQTMRERKQGIPAKRQKIEDIVESKREIEREVVPKPQPNRFSAFYEEGAQSLNDALQQHSQKLEAARSSQAKKKQKQKQKGRGKGDHIGVGSKPRKIGF